MENNFDGYLDPKDMPAFLNELAATYFKDDTDIMTKLASCSLYIHFVNAMMQNKNKEV